MRRHAALPHRTQRNVSKRQACQQNTKLAVSNTMTHHIHPFVAILALHVCTAAIYADYATTFSSPPYTIDQSAEGGLGYQADGSGNGGTVVLKKADVKVNSFYTYTFVIDYTKMTYDFRLTGLKKDESPFSYRVEGLAFQAKKKAVSRIYI